MPSLITEPASEMTLEPTPAILDLFKRITHPPVTLGDEPSDILDVVMADPEVKDHDEAAEKEKEKEKERKEKERKEEEEAKKKKPVVIAQPFTVPLTPSSSSASVKKSPEKAKEKEKEKSPAKSPVKMTISVPPRPRPIIPTTVTVSAGPTQPATKPVESSSATTPASKGTTIVTSLSGGTSSGVPVALPPAKGRMAKFWESTFSKPGAKPASAAPSTSSSAPATPSMSVSTPGATPGAMPEKAASAQSDTGPASVAARSPPQPSAPTSATTPNHTEQTGAPSSSAASTPAASVRTPVISNYAVCHHPNACHLPSARLRIFRNDSSGRGVHVANHHKSPCGCSGDPLSMILDATPLDFITAAFHLYTQAQSEKRKDSVIQKYKHAWNLCFPNRPAPFSGSAPFNFSQTQDFSEYGSLPANTRWVKPFVGDPSVSSIYSVPAASKHRSAVPVSFAPSYEEFFVDAATIAPRASLALSSTKSGDGASSISAPSSSEAQLPALADAGATTTSGSGTNTPKATTSDNIDKNSGSTEKGTTSGSSKSSAFETIQTAISGNRLQGPVEKVTPAKRPFEGGAASAEKSENDKGKEKEKETEKKTDEDERAAKKAKAGEDTDKDEKEDEDKDEDEDEVLEYFPKRQHPYQMAWKTASVKPNSQHWRELMFSKRIMAQPSSSESESEEEASEEDEEEPDSGDNYRPSKSVAAAAASNSASSKYEGKGKGTGSGSTSAPTGLPYKTAQKMASLARNQSGRSTVVPAGSHENAKKRKKDGVESPVRESASASNGGGMMSPAKKQKRLSGAGDGKEKQKEMEKMSGKTPLLTSTSTSTASTNTTMSASGPTRRGRLLLPAQDSTLYAAMSLVASAAVSASASTPKSMPTTTATTVQARTAAAAASPIGNGQQPMISHQDKGTTANLPRAAQGPAQSQSRSSEVELPQQKAKEAEASRGGPSPMVVDKPTTTPSSAVPAARAAPSTAVPPKAPTPVQAQAPAEAQAAAQAVQEMGPYITELATRFYGMVKPNAAPGEVAHAPHVLMEVLKVVNPQQATQLQLLGLQSSQPSQPQAQAQPQTPRPASAPRSPMLMSQQQASLPPQKRKGLYVPVVPSGNGGIVGASPSGLSLSATPPSGAVSGQPASPRFTHMDAVISPSSSSPQSSFNTNGSTVAGAPGAVVKSPPGALVPRPASAPGARRLNETTPSILLQSLSDSDKMKSLHTVYLMRDLLRFLTEDIVHPAEKKEGQQTPPPPEATQDGAENVNGTTPTPEAALDGMTMDDRLNVMASTTVALGNVIFHHRGAELERRVRDIDRLFEMHAVHLGGARGVFEGSSKDQQGEEGAGKGKGYGWLKISPTAVSEVRMLDELQGGHDESRNLMSTATTPLPAVEPMVVDDSVQRGDAMDVDMDGARSDVPDLVHGVYDGAIGSVNDSIVEEDFVDLDLQNLSPPQNDDDIASTPPASPRPKTNEVMNNVASDGSASTFTLAEVQKIKVQMEEERKRYEEELAHLRSTLSQLQEERMNQPVNGPRASQADTPGSIAELELLALNARVHALEAVSPGEENKPSAAMAAVEEFVRSQALITSRPSSPLPIASPQLVSTPAPLTPPPTAPMQAQQGLVPPLLSSHPLYHLLVGAGGDADSDLGLDSLSDDLVPSHPSRYPPRENPVAQQQNGAPCAPPARLPTSVPGPALSVHGPGIIASRSPSVPEVPVVIPGLGNAASLPVTPPTMPSISPSSSLGIASPIQAQGTGAGLTPNSASPPKASNSVADRSFPPRSKRKFEKVYGL
ncbi:hypothetical protein D9613_002407 [Agrocybe pediades]|uniref:Uncharacterized protein n=1 Tax=Agrocybe pediades TaxID=84607 RepID=A0A8H4R821_9AGAR|nr:hypothetical protein D9613_002407 [Agrocybe pediades]